MGARGKRTAFSKARWARSVRPRRRQLPQGPVRARQDGSQGGGHAGCRTGPPRPRTAVDRRTTMFASTPSTCTRGKLGYSPIIGTGPRMRGTPFLQRWPLRRRSHRRARAPRDARCARRPVPAAGSSAPWPTAALRILRDPIYTIPSNDGGLPSGGPAEWHAGLASG